jgi:tetratricopeptide (TPR) repeat protein
MVNGFDYRLKVNDFEQIETQSIRALRRGGRVFYNYRTTITGRGVDFRISSRGADYRRMIQRLFSSVSENVLDNRSIELRDYLAEPKEVLMKAEFVHIPSTEVLEESVLFEKHARRNQRVGPLDTDRAEYLRRLGNELRLGGHLLQALEAFRRAMIINPEDPQLLFEASRCLNSYAGTERDPRLHRRSLALLRLAERRASGNPELLARVGESYFQYGDWDRARRTFLRSIDQLGENFRSVRGMAEIALRDGKIAHVIHNFAAASRLAETPALRRWTRGETEYFSHLNDDDNYMEMEISRINLLETLDNSKRTATRIALFALPLIAAGMIFDEGLLTTVGWAVSSVALLIWVGLVVSVSMFTGRIPYEMTVEDE